LKNYDKALEDAEKCIAILPSWGKGFKRKGMALHG
jgi:stress-induced-phosphoprotein 1